MRSALCLLGLITLGACTRPLFVFQDDGGSGDLSLSGDLSVPGDLAAPDDLAAVDLPPTDFAGAMCPAAPTQRMVDVSTVSCDQLLAAYPGAVNRARACGCEKDCSVKVCDTLCCNCEVFVSPANDDFALVKAIAEEWKKRVGTGACQAPVCPAFACPDPTLTGCTLGRCLTMH